MMTEMPEITKAPTFQMLQRRTHTPGKSIVWILHAHNMKTHEARYDAAMTINGVVSEKSWQVSITCED